MTLSSMRATILRCMSSAMRAWRIALPRFGRSAIFQVPFGIRRGRRAFRRRLRAHLRHDRIGLRAFELVEPEKRHAVRPAGCRLEEGEQRYGLAAREKTEL